MGGNNGMSGIGVTSPHLPPYRRSAHEIGRDELERFFRRKLSQLPADAVVQLRILGSVRQDARPVLSAHRLRSLAPPAMNVEVKVVDARSETSRQPLTYRHLGR